MYFQNKVDLRIRDEELRLIYKACSEDPRYSSKSHFIRIAVLKELRRKYPKEMEELNKTLPYNDGGEY